MAPLACERSPGAGLTIWPMTTSNRVAFVGSKSMGLRVLETMIAGVRPPHVIAGAVTLADQADVRSCLSGFRATAMKANCPLAVAADAQEGHALLRELRPSIVIVCGWYAMIPLRRFTAQFYGFHAGPLPRYRGGSPVVWQIIKGESRIGLTLFRLGPRVDAGEIVAQSEVPLAVNETIAVALTRLEDLAVDLLRSSFPAILSGSADLHPQDDARASTYPQRSPADGEIDLVSGAKRVHDFVRAQTAPYPGAFVRMADGRILRIWMTELLHERHSPPGVITLTADGPLIGCGEGSVRVVSASVDGEPERPLEQLLRGVQLPSRPVTSS